MLQVRKNFLFLSLIIFVNMLIRIKLLPPCLVFVKVHFTILRIANMLRMKCFMFLESGEKCVGQGYAWYGTQRLEKNIQFATNFHLL